MVCFGDRVRNVLPNLGRTREVVIKVAVSAIDKMRSYKQATKARIKAPKVTSRR